MGVAQEKLQILRTKLDKYPVLQKAEDKFNVPKEILVLGGSVLFAPIVVFGVGIASLSNLVGFVYPAFKSFQAIETKNKGDDTQWLVYWVIFAFFSIIEVFVDFLLYWIPFYYPFKLAFLLWAMLPQTKGAQYLYNSCFKDFLKKNESRIDSALADAKKQAGSIAGDFANVTSDLTAAAAASSTTAASSATAAASATEETKKDS